jgi:hypothetical protein
MAEVGVEVKQVIKVMVDRIPDRGQGGRSQAELAGPMQHIHIRQVPSDLVGNPAGSVRRVIVDHEDRAIGSKLADGLN